MHTSNQKIYLGSDHGGFRLKKKIKQWLTDGGYEWEDLGNNNADSKDDYPYFALLVASRVRQDEVAGRRSLGVLACRSAAGMVIAANKVHGVRAASASSVVSARLSRTHNDANVLALGADMLSPRKAKTVLRTWLAAAPEVETRHRYRLEQIERFERGDIEITPGIFEKTAEGAARRLKQAAGVTAWLHVDVADGRFVESLSLQSFDSFAASAKKVSLEAHLMTEKPWLYLNELKRAGFKRAFAHLETPGIEAFLKEARRQGIEAGIAVDLNTDIRKVKRFLRRVKYILMMAVEAGASGQQLNPAVFDKVDTLKTMTDASVVVDGGVNLHTIGAVVACGADRVVSTSYLFQGGGSIAKRFSRLKHFNQL